VQRPAHRTSERSPTIFVSAGEPSGDLHGAALVRALRSRFPDARILGLGGSRMAAEGVELLADVSDLAVMGFAEVAARLPFFLWLRRRVFSALAEEQVELVIPIDYPGFNLRLARRARIQRIPVLFYIAPQVWAWHASRAKDLARDASRIAVILPFEEEFLRNAGGRVEYVGHPLLDAERPSESRAAWAERFDIDPSRPLLAIFPGSRAQEISRHLELFSDTAERVTAELSHVQPVIGLAPDLDRALFRGAPWPLVDSTSGLLHHADAALVKSGTTTLEAALAGTPFVVAYRMNRLTYQVARRLVRVPHIALANLVAGQRIAPEFIQHEATPEALCQALLPLLDPGSAVRKRVAEGLEDVRRRLERGGAADRVAAIAADLLTASA
jgi:lipid-A-disaccharide synthase